jgi:drug/metabolite transporter (DMT)-like permease
MMNFMLTVALFAACLLLFGAWKLWRREGTSQKMWLMIAAALVIFANIAMWVVPDKQGKSLATEAK